MAEKTKNETSPLTGKLRQVIDPLVAKALSHPLRSHILLTLGDGLASPNEMARELGLQPRDLNYHVKVLLEMGMIRLVRKEKRRGAKEHFYELCLPVFQIDDLTWERLSQAMRGNLSAHLFQLVIDDALEALEAGTFGARGSHQSRTPMVLDEEGWREVTEVMEATLKRVLEIGRRSAKDLQQSGSEGIPIEVFLLGFETAKGAGAKTGAAAHGSPH